MVSFDLMPNHDKGVAQRAQYDLSRMKGVAKFRKALAVSNAYRVRRSNNQIVVEYIVSNGPDDIQVQARFIYELAPPFV